MLGLEPEDDDGGHFRPALTLMAMGGNAALLPV